MVRTAINTRWLNHTVGSLLRPFRALRIARSQLSRSSSLAHMKCFSTVISFSRTIGRDDSVDSVKNTHGSAGEQHERWIYDSNSSIESIFKFVLISVTLLMTSNTWFTFFFRLKLHRGSVFSSNTRYHSYLENLLISCCFFRILSVITTVPVYNMEGGRGYQINFPIVTITYFRFHVDTNGWEAFLRRIPHFRISAPCSKRAGFWLISIISSNSKAQFRNVFLSSRIRFEASFVDGFESRHCSWLHTSRLGDPGYAL